VTSPPDFSDRAAEGRIPPAGSQRDRARALSLILRVGRTATAFRALGEELHHWFDGERGLVAYRSTAGALVSAGEPVARPQDVIAVAEAFVAHAGRHGRRASFFATEGMLAASPRFRRVMLGEQPVWNPQSWNAHLTQHRSLREQLRRARAKGVEVQVISADALRDARWTAPIEQLITRWYAARPLARLGFLVTVDPFTWPTERRTLVAHRAHVPVALLSMVPVPARNGWLLEHLLRDPDAPNGTAELLVDAAMRALATDGVTWATLGLAPLSGNVSGWLRRVRTYSRPLFNFEGLAAFKRKLRPHHWEPIYLAYPSEQSSVRAMWDGLHAFAGGALWRFGARTVWRGPALVLRLLEWLLVPWTIALAVAPLLASPGQWFPSSAVHVGWVLFDVALLVALRHLRAQMLRRGVGSRVRAWHAARIVATAVTIDAVLTIVQALWWNASRVTDVTAVIIVAVACSGPTLAALVLWGAARRLRRLCDFPISFPPCE
jgi:phosphatidylglycerol lysyltransferase